MSPARVPMDQRPSGEELSRLYVDKEMTCRQIAEEVGFSDTTIRNWLMEAGVELRPSVAMKPKTPLEQRATVPIEDLRRMYVEEGLSLSQISERTGVHFATIGVWLKEAGVVMRGYDPEFPYGEGWRAVESRKEVPYDTTWDGKILMAPVDVLECGHEMRGASKRRAGGGQIEWQPQPKYRKCLRCIREEES